MLYAFIGHDKHDAGTLRADNRPAHLAFLDSLGDRLKAAGPHIEHTSGTPAGSLVIVEGESLEEVIALFEQDPYAQAGLFYRSEVLPYKLLLGDWATEG